MGPSHRWRSREGCHRGSRPDWNTANHRKSPRGTPYGRHWANRGRKRNGSALGCPPNYRHVTGNANGYGNRCWRRRDSSFRSGDPQHHRSDFGGKHRHGNRRRVSSAYPIDSSTVETPAGVDGYRTSAEFAPTRSIHVGAIVARRPGRDIRAGRRLKAAPRRWPARVACGGGRRICVHIIRSRRRRALQGFVVCRSPGLAGRPILAARFAPRNSRLRHSLSPSLMGSSRWRRLSTRRIWVGLSPPIGQCVIACWSTVGRSRRSDFRPAIRTVPRDVDFRRRGLLRSTHQAPNSAPFRQLAGSPFVPFHRGAMGALGAGPSRVDESWEGVSVLPR